MLKKSYEIGACLWQGKNQPVLDEEQNDLEICGYFVEKISLFTTCFVKKDLRFAQTLVIMKIVVIFGQYNWGRFFSQSIRHGRAMEPPCGTERSVHMKKLRQSVLLLLAAIMVFTLCSCGEKVKPEKIDTKDFSREIEVEVSGDDLEIVQADKSVRTSQTGDMLKADDSIRIGAGSGAVLNAEGNKHIFADENTSLRLEASGTPESSKTRICLEEGSVICGLDEALAEGELFEVQTPGGTVSITGGVVRVSMLPYDVRCLLVECFEGAATVVINKTGATATVQAGGAALVRIPEKKDPSFVRADEINSDAWKSGETTNLKIGENGSGSITFLPIPYARLSDAALEQLLDYAEKGHSLIVSEQTLNNLRETGHDYVETVVTEATCTQDGVLKLECAICGDKTEQAIPALGHQEEEIPGQDAACTEDGLTAGKRCAVCGEVLEEQTVIPALGHQAEPISALEPTCTESGLTEGSVCAICGEILTVQEETPCTEHIPETIPGKEASCSEPGLTEGSKCTVCGEILTAQEETPCAEHTPETLPAREATCTQTGLTEGSKCAVCGKILVMQKTTPCVKHTPETLPGKEASCSEPGLTEGSKCTVCGKILTEQKEIPCIDHTPEVVPGKEATCTETGLTEGSKCIVCGEILVSQKTIPYAAHTPEAIPGKEATCTETGLTEGSKCAVCGKILKEQEEIPCIAHTPEAVPGKEATCTKTGLTEGSKCVVCGKILSEQQTVPCIPHTPEVLPAKEASCAEEGLTEGSKCAVCGEILKEQKAVACLAHTPVTVPGKETSCAHPGLTDGQRCEVCGKVLVRQELIPRIPHTRGGLAYRAPTCSYPGRTAGLACQICGHIMLPTKYIPKLPHTPGTVDKIFNSAVPLLDQNGNLMNTKEHPNYCYYEASTCEVCGEYYTMEYFKHVPGEEVRTTTEDGIVVSVNCAECGRCVSRHMEPLPEVPEETVPETTAPSKPEETVPETTESSNPDESGNE